MSDRFEDWLEQELSKGLSARTRQVRPSPAQLTSIVGSKRGRGLRGGVTAKAMVVALAAVVVTATGAMAAGTVATGSPNPLDWGQKVKAHAATCKAQLKPGEHGIGKCVSSFAKQHGQAERQQHSQAGQHGKSPHTPGPPAHTPKPPHSPEPGDSPEPQESPGS